jgi:hypothetical protein
MAGPIRTISGHSNAYQADANLFDTKSLILIT